MIEIAEFVPDRDATSGEHVVVDGAVHRSADPPSEVLDPADPASRGYRYRYGSSLITESEEPLHVLSLTCVQDFYDDRNATSDRTCHLELASPDLADVQRLRRIIGAEVHPQPVGEGRVRLSIDQPSA